MLKIKNAMYFIFYYVVMEGLLKHFEEKCRSFAIYVLLIIFLKDIGPGTINLMIEVNSFPFNVYYPKLLTITKCMLL